MNTQKQLRTRRSVIVAELTRMSYQGWHKFKASDYQPLEAELREIEPKLKRRS
jgi:replication fork clamp-binding protein CrfC